MKILTFIDRNFWLVLVVSHVVIGCGWLLYQGYEGVQISASLVFRALFPAIMWLAIWLGLRSWLRRYSVVDSASCPNRKIDN